MKRMWMLAAALAPTPARARTLFRFPAEDPQGTLFMKNLIVHVDHDTANTGTRTKCSAWTANSARHSTRFDRKRCCESCCR